MGKGKRKREAKQQRIRDGLDTGQKIQLGNPIAHQFKNFIVENATACEQVVQTGSAKGQHIVICGAGPSLRDHAAEWCPQGDQVWGCNSAATYLQNNGHRITHGFTIDQTTHMLAEWLDPPPVEYLVASSIHPHLVEWLQDTHGRKVTFFHNYVGVRERPVQMEDGTLVAYEDWLYTQLYEPTVRAGSGLNSVSRAIDVALVMGAEKITVLGADCALTLKRPRPEGMVQQSPQHIRWLEDDVVMHADGGNALRSGATSTTVGGRIDGRWWETKPDMMVTAVFLVQMVRAFPRIQLIGDTLPNALMDKPDEYLDRLPSLTGQDGNRIAYTPPSLTDLGAAAI